MDQVVYKPDRGDIKNLVSIIRTGNVIPIIGYDLLQGDFLKENFLKYVKLYDKELNNLDPNLPGNVLINKYYHSIKNELDVTTIKSDFQNILRGENDFIISDSLKKISQVKHFKLFINATLSQALQKQLSTYVDCDVLAYRNVNEPLDLEIDSPIEDHQKNFARKLKKPVVYNLFGDYGENWEDIILTEADYIELIYDFIERDPKRMLPNLRMCLKNAGLLFLGCNFPDWFFRFFIRIAVGERLDNIPDRRLKMIIDSLNHMDNNKALFIDYYGLTTYSIDCNELVDELYKDFSQDQRPEQNLYDEDLRKVFISYSWKDKITVDHLAAQFRHNNIRYYRDLERIEVGQELPATIADAINKCSTFLAIVSPNVQESEYTWREWVYAHTNNDWMFSAGAGQPNYLTAIKDSVDHQMMLAAKWGVSQPVKDAFLAGDNSPLAIVINKKEVDLANPDDLAKMATLYGEENIAAIKAGLEETATTTIYYLQEKDINSLKNRTFNCTKKRTQNAG